MATAAPSSLPSTYFDAPERTSAGDLARMASDIRAGSCLVGVLDGLPTPTFVLNDHREIVVANQAGLELAHEVAGQEPGVGQRLGEALACVNAPHGPAGCGTAPGCRYCGAGQVQFAYRSQPGSYDAELRLRSKANGVESAHTFRVHLAPLEVGPHHLRLCSLDDITAVKSREALDRIFFHDVLNTAQAVQGAASLMPATDEPEPLAELARVVSTNTTALIREIEAQRDLVDAESGRLRVDLEPLAVDQMAREIVALYRHAPVSQGRALSLDLPPSGAVAATSATHLARCIGNLVKNALEASTPGETVTLSVASSTDSVGIAVHNPGVMPESVQAQVFQRHFSTKRGRGRGLGVYSVRLLVERYLGGQVSFESTPERGTTFVIRVPCEAAPVQPGEGS